MSLLIVFSSAYGQLFTTSLQGSAINGIAYEDGGRGDILFATTTGLWRFNGKDFIQIPIQIKATANSAPVTVNPGELTDVIIDNDHQIWVGSRLGLFIKKGGFWKHVPSDSGAPSNNISNLFLDASGKIWVGTDTDTAGVGIFDGRRWYRLRVSSPVSYFEIFKNNTWGKPDTTFPSSRGPRDNHINVIYQDAQKGIWIGSRTGARRFSGELEKRSVALFANWCRRLDNLNVTAFAEAKDGRVYAGTGSNGVIRMHPNCGAVIDTLNMRTSPLPNNRINDIEVDREGNLWFGTNDGVCRYNPQAQSFRCYSANDFPNLVAVKTVFADPDNNLWFGMAGLQTGVIRLNHNWFSFGNEILPPGLFVESLLGIRDTLWVGTSRGLARIQAETKLDVILPDNWINTLAPAPNSRVWVGLYDDVGGVFLYDANGQRRCNINLNLAGKHPKLNQIQQIIQRGEEVWIAADSLLTRARAADCTVLATYSRQSTQGGLVNDQIFAIDFDQSGKLWCGTPAGVSVYDPAANQWSATYTTANGLFEDNNVTTIAVDPTNGDVWAGTARGGISIYNGASWRQLSRRTVLADNFINRIVFSSSGEVFVATPRGVNRRDRQGLWTTFDFQSGLAADYVTSIALQGDSLRWFGTRGAGLTRYRPPQSKPQTFIETRLEVTDQANVSFRFSAADLNTASNEFRYRYWLDGDPPSEPTSDRFAEIKGVAPGPHTFYVQAIDRDGNLDPEADRDFFTVIVPKFGGASVTKDSTSFHRVGKITVSVYWPPNLLKENTAITIAPDTTIASALFAFGLAGGERFNLPRPMTLTFSFPDSAVKGKNLGIFKVGGNNQLILLGGNEPAQKEKNVFSLSTAILELGVYAVKERPKTSSAVADSLQNMFRITAQPRLIHADGRRHGSQTAVTFKLDQPALVRLEIYNLAGRLVKTIDHAGMQAGVNILTWNGRDKNGDFCPPGLYLLAVISNGFSSPPKPVKVMVMN